MKVKWIFKNVIMLFQMYPPERQLSWLLTVDVLSLGVRFYVFIDNGGTLLENI